MGFLLANHMVFAGQNTVLYENKQGSTLELNFTQQNTLTGTFTTAIASKKCQSVIGTKRPVIGYIDGTAITFSINYPSCGSIVTLTGHITPQKDIIDAITVIAHQTKTLTKDMNAQLIRHDTFVKKSA